MNNSAATTSQKDNKSYLDDLRENLASAYLSALMLAHIQEKKLSCSSVDKNGRFLVRVLEKTLADQVVVTLARVWERGGRSKDQISIPNIKNLSSICIPTEVSHEISKTAKSKFVGQVKCIRDEYVAHSLICRADRTFSGEDFQSCVEQSLSILDKVYRVNFNERIDTPDLSDTMSVWCHWLDSLIGI